MGNADFKYEQDVKVDRDDLDSEWIKQPALYAHWAKEYAVALAIKDRIWLEKKILKATLYKTAKTAMTDAGGKPITDSRADAEVHSDPQYADVSNRLIDAEERVNVLDGIKWAMEQKKASLTSLSRDSNRAFNMPDGAKSAKDQAEEALERKRYSDEEFNKAVRGRIKRG